MSVYSRCRKYVNELPTGQCFATRELLTYGHRDAVDKCTQAMVGSGFVLRMARGVFVRNDLGLKLPTIEEIAETKARAFSKHMLPSKVAQAGVFGLEKPFKPRKKNSKTLPKKVFPPATATFSVLGTTSMFLTVHGYVKLEHISARKFFVAQHDLGKMLTGIWHASKDANINFEMLLWKANFAVTENRKFRQLAAWVPEWVHEHFRSPHESLLVHVPWRLYPFVEVPFPEVLSKMKPFSVQEGKEIYRFDTGCGASELLLGSSQDEAVSPRLRGLLVACLWGEHKFNMVRDHFSSS